MSHSSSNGSDLTARYAFVQFSFWMNFASIVGFASIYLLSTGFSNTQIGIMIAAAGILSALLQLMIHSVSGNCELMMHDFKSGLRSIKWNIFRNNGEISNGYIL